MNFDECEVFYCSNGSEMIDDEIDILYIDHLSKTYMVHKNASLMIIDGCDLDENDIYDYKLISKSLFDLLVAKFRKSSYEEWDNESFD